MGSAKLLFTSRMPRSVKLTVQPSSAAADSLRVITTLRSDAVKLNATLLSLGAAFKPGASSPMAAEP
ncbi:unknown [Prevotella sp. CAG:5226]|nr:unknown [Prevotella sp. CAG:5226]